MGLDHSIRVIIYYLDNPTEAADLYLTHVRQCFGDFGVRLYKNTERAELVIEGDYMLIPSNDIVQPGKWSADFPQFMVIYIDVVQHTAYTSVYLGGVPIHMCSDDSDYKYI